MRQQRTTPYYHAAIMPHIRGNLKPNLSRAAVGEGYASCLPEETSGPRQPKDQGGMGSHIP